MNPQAVGKHRIIPVHTAVTEKWLASLSTRLATICG
jgi:hypothetical protein